MAAPGGFQLGRGSRVGSQALRHLLPVGGVKKIGGEAPRQSGHHPMEGPNTQSCVGETMPPAHDVSGESGS